MPSAVITVTYVNQAKPDKKEGSVKDTGGEYWGVAPAMLGLFQPNGTYEIQYEDTNFKGKVFHHVKSVKTVAATARATKPASNNGGQSSSRYNNTDDKTAERIFVCGVVNAAIHAGAISTQATDLVATVLSARAAWQQTFGKPAQAQTSAPPQTAAQTPIDQDMNDDIPY